MRLTSLAKPVGWFSLALGAAELLAPRRIASAHGAPRRTNLVRGFGAREIAAGLSVLARPNSSAPFLMRAAGDLLDLGAAGAAARTTSGRARNVALGSALIVVGFLALDLLLASQPADD